LLKNIVLPKQIDVAQNKQINFKFYLIQFFILCHTKVKCVAIFQNLAAPLKKYHFCSLE